MPDLTVTTEDRADSPDFDLPVVLVLDRLRSAFNVGNIFRLAEACGVRKIVTCGYTATPPHPKLEKTARGCTERVDFSHCKTSLEAVEALKADGYFTVAVETVENAPVAWELDYNWPVAFVLGNEALGVSEDTLAACDACVQLPVFGLKNSLNVGNCAAVVVYDAVRRFEG
jgi:tRNA G18 (ribose-2'-O)-methylase SpoU